VEINALWYNALKLLEAWLQDAPQAGLTAEELAQHAQRVHASFNECFWYEDGEYLYDVIDGETGVNDPACRPNQLLAISLKHPVLDPSRWERIVQVAEERLLTPVGLRSLAPGHPDYKSRYYGDLRSRDAAYHQGTVWGWLIGPFIDAWLKVHPHDRAGARRFVEGFHQQLDEGAIGTISEIFDAEPPYQQRGCIAQAWSVAEVLRAYQATKDAPAR
jgi:glycogen debranching enzyme